MLAGENVALNETVRLMAEIDEVIEAHGGWPGASQSGSEAEAASERTATVIPFRPRAIEPAPEDRYVTCVPLVPLKAAAGGFGDPQHILATHAGDLAWKHGLRGYDTAQLAAALAWREATEDAEDEVVFACFDNHLRRAARLKGSKHGPTEQPGRRRPRKSRMTRLALRDELRPDNHRCTT